MKIQGNITMLVGSESTTIDLRDENANVVFAKIELSPVQLSQILSRLSSVPCEIDVLGLDKIGKKHENKKFEFALPPSDSYLPDKKNVFELASTLVEPGWVVDNYFGSQDSFFVKDGVKMARCTIRRWV